MKKLLLLLLVFPLVFTSCSNDDDDDEKVIEALLGTWVHGGSYGIIETDKANITETLLAAIKSEANVNQTLTFMKDGKLTSGVSTISYTVKGNTITLRREGSTTVEDAISYTYTLKGGNLELFRDITKDLQVQYQDHGFVIAKAIFVEKYTKE